MIQRPSRLTPFPICGFLVVFGMFASELRAQIPGPECSFETDIVVSLSATTGDSLLVRSGAGRLEVEGRNGLEEIRAVGHACAQSERDLNELRLTLEESDDEIVLTAHYPQGSIADLVTGSASINLVVEVPSHMEVTIEDSSGSIEVRGTGTLSIEDGSGSISVEDVQGSLSVDDGSGSLRVENIAGDVDIADGSGSINVHGVQGTVRVRRDGSGSISVTEITGDVVIVSDGSGSISVEDVSGDFSVGSDGSGGIRHRRVEGAIDIPED